MVRPKDPFWKYAENLKNGRFSCNFCHDQFAGGISRVKWHLSGLTSHDIQVCRQVPQDIRLAVRQVLDTPKKKERQVEYENCPVSSSSRGKNLSNSDNKKLLDKQLADWFFLFDINPKAILSPIIKDVVKSIGEYGSSYQLPSLDTLGKELINVHEDAFNYQDDFRSDQVQASCTLMVVDYHCGQIFACSQTGVACLDSFNKRLGSDYISKAISDAIEFLGPNRVLQLLISDVYRWFHISREFENHQSRVIVSCCAAKVVDGFLKDMTWELRSTICFVKLIFYTYHHYNASSIRGMKIPEDDFAFTLLMLESVLNIEDELQDVSFSNIIESSEEVKLLDDEQGKASHSICGKLLDYIIGHKEFWSRVKLVAQVWVLLFQTRCLVNLEDSNIGYLYQMMERLKEGMEKSHEQDHFISDRSWKSFSEMRENIIYPIHAAAAFLDPAYWCTDNIMENAEMKDGINYIFENMVDSDEKEAFTVELQQYRMKLGKLFTAQAITMLKTCHPRIWWDFCGKHTVPVLSKYAIRILSQPCSTSFCRRYQMMGADCNLLEDWSPDDEDYGVRWTIKVNTMIKNENFRSLKLKPIIFDKLGEDRGAFSDRTEERIKTYISYLSLSLTDVALVDCAINDSGSFWDNVSITTLCLGIDSIFL